LPVSSILDVLYELEATMRTWNLWLYQKNSIRYNSGFDFYPKSIILSKDDSILILNSDLTYKMSKKDWESEFSQDDDDEKNVLDKSLKGKV